MRRLLPFGVLLLVSAAIAGCGTSGGGSTTYTISGTITGASTVTVALAGAQSASTTSDSSGHYQFGELNNGNYTITPSLPGYGFTPPSRQATVSGADVPGQDFSGIQFAYGWLAKASMLTPRNVLAAAIVNGKIYTLGGWTVDANGTGSASAALEEYDPGTNTWTAKAPMPTPRSQLAAAAVNGRVYAMGGWSDQVEEYDPATDTWKTKAPMPTGLAGHAAAVVNGKVYAIGGSLVEEYDPVADTWKTKAPMPTPRYWLAVVEVNGKVYAIGGWDDPLVSNVTKSFDTVEEYDPATDTWTTRAPMPTARGALAAAALNGRIHVIGGEGFLNSVDEYDPVTDSWAASLPMPTGRNALAAVTLNDDIYAVGGWNWHGPLAAVEAYTRAETHAPSLVEIPGSPFVWTSAVNSNVVLLSHDETTMFVSNQGSSSLSVLAVAPGGALTLLGIYPTGRVPTGMALDPAGTRLYVATEDGIAVHEVAPDHSLSQIGLSPHPAGAGPVNGIRYVTTRSGSAFLYANENTYGANLVAGYPVLPSGLLDLPVTWPTGAPGSSSGMFGPQRLVFDGARLFAGNDGTVSVFDVNPDGSLALVPGSPFTPGIAPPAHPPYSGPYAPALALDPSGGRLYAILDGYTPVRFAVLSDGTLKFEASFEEVPTYPVTGLSVHPSGHWLAAAYGPTWIRVWDTRAPGTPVWTGYGAIDWNAAGTLAFGGGGSLTEALVGVYSFTE